MFTNAPRFFLMALLLTLLAACSSVPANKERATAELAHTCAHSPAETSIEGKWFGHIDGVSQAGTETFERWRYLVLRKNEDGFLSGEATFHEDGGSFMIMGKEEEGRVQIYFLERYQDRSTSRDMTLERTGGRMEGSLRSFTPDLKKYWYGNATFCKSAPA